MSHHPNADPTQFIETSATRRRVLKTAAAGAAAAALLPVARLGGVAAQEPLRIAFSVPGLNFPFFVHMMNLAEQHAAEIGVEFIPLDGQQNGAPSSTKQSNDLETVVTQGVSGIIISPNDVNAVAPAIQAAIDAGVPVVTVDRNVTEATTLAHVGADNVRGGELQGEYVVQILPDGGGIFELLGQPGASPAIDRNKGLTNVLSENPQIELVASQTAEFSRDRAVTVMESLLTANDVPDAVVCANDDMAFGVAEVAEQGGDSFPIIGFDALPEALIAIRDGRMAATIEQFPGQQATTAMDILVAFLTDGTEPAEHDTYLVPIIVTADNLAEAERAEEAGVGGSATPEATPTA